MGARDRDIEFERERKTASKTPFGFFVYGALYQGQYICRPAKISSCFSGLRTNEKLVCFCTFLGSRAWLGFARLGVRDGWGSEFSIRILDLNFRSEFSI